MACVQLCVCVLCMYLKIMRSLYRVKVEDNTQQYFQDDPELPVYSCVCTPYKSHRLINILLDDSIDKWQVCGVQPLGVTENATFIINLDLPGPSSASHTSISLWVSSKICSLTVAVVEQCGKLAAFLNWYVITNQETNITSSGLLHAQKSWSKGWCP